MIDPAIQTFFQELKDKQLKKEIKPTMSDEEKHLLEGNLDKNLIGDWLANAAKNAGQRQLSTHPCTFSHPSARRNKNGYVTSVVAEADRSPDGYVRTGNSDVTVGEDTLGSAATLGVHKFLMLVMQDGKRLLQHIEEDSALAKGSLTTQTENYQKLREGFLAIKHNDADSITGSKIKQVYFPVEDDYHLLSILSHSGLIYELRQRIDALRFSHKELRELKRNNKYSEKGFSEIYNITTVAYGGTQPQNVSGLNSQFGGKARLLLSVPPNLQKRDIQFQKKTSSVAPFDIRTFKNHYKNYTASSKA